jgi:hypothetical protein
VAKQKPPKLVLPNYPYRNRFSPEQTDEALARKDQLVELMMDAVGPDGTVINVPVDLLHILGFHLAFAGADVHTDHRQLIEARILPNEANDNEYGMRFEDMRIWKARGDFHDEPPANESQQEANLLAAQLRRQSTPEVREALAKIFADEFGAQAASHTVNDRQRAENVILETREMRDKYRDGGDG